MKFSLLHLVALTALIALSASFSGMQAQTMPFEFAGGGPTGYIQGKQVVRANYTYDAQALAEAFASEGKIRLPFAGMENVLFNICPQTPLGPQLEVPSEDYASWTLLSEHFTGAALRKNGQFYFRFFAPYRDAFNFFFELSPIQSGALMQLSYFNGNSDLPYPAKGGGGNIQSQSAFDSWVAGDAGYDPNTMGSATDLPDPSTWYNHPSLSAQAFGESVAMNEAHCVHTIYTVSPEYVAQATGSRWLNEEANNYTLLDYLALYIAECNAIGFKETGRMLSIEYIITYTQSDFQTMWGTAQQEFLLENPGGTFPVYDPSASMWNQARSGRLWTGSCLIRQWLRENGGAYDMGHNFFATAASMSTLNTVCDADTLVRGRTISGPAGQPGLEYHQGLMMHEVGHGWNANHTFNFAKAQRNPERAREPGSGLSLMGYVRTGNVEYEFTDNSASNSVSFSAYDMVFNELKAESPPRSAFVEYYSRYHPTSMQQYYTANGPQIAGCMTPMDVPNSQLTMPQLTEGTAEFNYIPANTPFVLSAHPQSTRLYSWSQNESGYNEWDYFDDFKCLEPSAFGPLFMFGERNASAVRFFPPLDHLDEADAYERHFVLPAEERMMTFALTVQPNPEKATMAHGSKVYDGLKVSVQNGPGFELTAGPGVSFDVASTDPESADLSRYEATIEWNVAGTDQAPINCTSLDVYYTDDPSVERFSDMTLLASNVPNTGIATVEVPASVRDYSAPGIAFKRGRILLKSPDHIFFAASPSFIIHKAGCGNPLALNYDPEVGETILSMCDVSGGLNSCDNPLACNFNFVPNSAPNCVFPVCQDETALNYEPYYSGYTDFISTSCSEECLFDLTPCTQLPGKYDDDLNAWFVYGNEGPMDLFSWTYSLGYEGDEGMEYVTEAQGANKRVTWLADGALFEIHPPDISSLSGSADLPMQFKCVLESPVFSADRKVKFKFDDGNMISGGSAYLPIDVATIQNGQATPAANNQTLDLLDFIEVPAHSSLVIQVRGTFDWGSNPVTFKLTDLAYEDLCIAGCMDATAMNYDPEATSDGGNCFWLPPTPGANSMEDDEEGLFVCLDPQACNYADGALWGLHKPEVCMYAGCQLPMADNYDPYAQCPGTCCYNGVCADQAWWEAEGRRVIHGEEWGEFVGAGGALSTTVLEGFNNVDLQGTGLLIEVPPGGMTIEFYGDVEGDFELAYALVNFPGNDLPECLWNNGVTIDLLNDPKGYNDMSLAMRNFLLPPQALPFYDELELVGEAATTAGFYSMMNEIHDGNGKIQIGPTPAGSTPPVLILSSLLMPSASCSGEEIALGCMDAEAINFDALATVDDGTCTAGGCMDPFALNFNGWAALPRAECVYEGPCADLVVSDAMGFGFTGAYQPNAIAAMSHPERIEFVGDHAVVLTSGDAGSADSTWVEWVAPADGTFRFAWRYATNDGFSYDPPFYQTNDTNFYPLELGLDLESLWSGAGNISDGTAEWQPSVGTSLPDVAALPAIFTNGSIVYDWMGAEVIEVQAGQPIRLGIRTTDGVYGAGHLVIASPIWSHSCPAQIPNVSGCTDPTACNFNPSASTDDGSCWHIGAPCDDENACTYGDVVTANCSCQGTFADADGDGVCDAQDGCPEEAALTAPGECGCFTATYIASADDWMLPCEVEATGCVHPLAANYSPHADLPSTCLYDGPCESTITLDGKLVGLNGYLAPGQWNFENPGEANVDMYHDAQLLGLSTFDGPVASGTILASIEVEEQGLVQFSWAAFVAQIPSEDSGWQPFYAINGQSPVYLEPSGTFSPGGTLDSPIGPDFDLQSWQTEDPDWFASGIYTPADSLILPDLNNLPFVQDVYDYHVMPFNEVVGIAVNAGDVLTLGLSSSPEVIHSHVVFSGWMAPGFSCSVSTGCTYPQACNYSPDATSDDGSCTFAEPMFDCAGNPLVGAPVCPEDINGDGLVSISDMLQLLAAYGAECLN